MVLLTQINRMYGVGGSTPFMKVLELTFDTKEQARTYVKGDALNYKDKEKDVVDIDGEDVMFLSHNDGYDTTEDIYIITERG